MVIFQERRGLVRDLLRTMLSKNYGIEFVVYHIPAEKRRIPKQQLPVSIRLSLSSSLLG